MLERISDNAYKHELPGEYGVIASFNVSNLSLFDVGDDLRTNPFQEGENDAISTTQRHRLRDTTTLQITETTLKRSTKPIKWSSYNV